MLFENASRKNKNYTQICSNPVILIMMEDYSTDHGDDRTADVENDDPQNVIVPETACSKRSARTTQGSLCSDDDYDEETRVAGKMNAVSKLQERLESGTHYRVHRWFTDMCHAASEQVVVVHTITHMQEHPQHHLDYTTI